MVAHMVRHLARLGLVCLAVAVFIVPGCGRGHANAGGGAKTDESKLFRLEAPAVTLAAAEAGALVVRIVAGEGWKWNEEYPVSLTVAGDELSGLTFPKPRLRRGDSEITATEKSATLRIPVTANAAGDYEVPLKANFSVCDEKLCHIFRNRDVVIPIQVREGEMP
jgi:hypothetical protein